MQIETSEDLENLIISYRDIRGSICKSCQGWGTKLYANTATWHGGIGGNALTSAVCDKCWGSGDITNPWPSWRK